MSNLSLRLISSFFLLIFFYFLISADRHWFNFFINIILFFTLWEYFRLIRFRMHKIENQVAYGSILGRIKLSLFDYILILFILLLNFLNFNEFNYLWLLIFFFIVCLFKVVGFNYKTIIGTFYVSLPFFILVEMRDSSDFILYFAFIIFFSILTDASAFFIGKKIGGIKLAKSISPNKTIAGSLGGVIVPTFICVIFYKNHDFSLIILSSILFSITVQVGDLIESTFKRYCFTKESSNLIPGHGGILDRLDGILLLVIVIAILKVMDFNFFFVV